MKINLALTALASATLLASGASFAQGQKLKVGLMLPATGTYAALGTAIENGFRLYVDEQGGKLGGRTFLFTGTLEQMSRREASERVKTNGGKLLSGKLKAAVLPSVELGIDLDKLADLELLKDMIDPWDVPADVGG